MSEFETQRLTPDDIAMPVPAEPTPSSGQFDWRSQDDARIQRIIDLSPGEVEHNRGLFTASEYKEFLALSILAGEGRFDTFDTPSDPMRPQRDRFAHLTAIKEGRHAPTTEINLDSNN